MRIGAIARSHERLADRLRQRETIVEQRVEIHAARSERIGRRKLHVQMLDRDDGADDGKNATSSA
jgi:hypothetical protein